MSSISQIDQLNFLWENFSCNYSIKLKELTYDEKIKKCIAIFESYPSLYTNKSILCKVWSHMWIPSEEVKFFKKTVVLRNCEDRGWVKILKDSSFFDNYEIKGFYSELLDKAFFEDKDRTLIIKEGFFEKITNEEFWDFVEKESVQNLCIYKMDNNKLFYSRRVLKQFLKNKTNLQDMFQMHTLLFDEGTKEMLLSKALLSLCGQFFVKIFENDQKKMVDTKIILNGPFLFTAFLDVLIDVELNDIELSEMHTHYFGYASKLKKINFNPIEMTEDLIFSWKLNSIFERIPSYFKERIRIANSKNKLRVLQQLYKNNIQKASQFPIRKIITTLDKSSESLAFIRKLSQHFGVQYACFQIFSFCLDENPYEILNPDKDKVLITCASPDESVKQIHIHEKLLLRIDSKLFWDIVKQYNISKITVCRENFKETIYNVEITKKLRDLYPEISSLAHEIEVDFGGIKKVYITKAQLMLSGTFFTEWLSLNQKNNTLTLQASSLKYKVFIAVIDNLNSDHNLSFKLREMDVDECIQCEAEIRFLGYKYSDIT